ncbi:hypothetical protein BN59_03082 [Legionella massiliensis]|uniref:Sialate O-acetylesterase domain-containing protein n=1 Tax=Legionella massiliensis TaxID=1034943 RepID=A0A078L4A0_9GAMM|nr:sialate O-acetylesterase [Legionella massiliensis]CDZ78768.1 hypothetical protein BN59_03082 [Legionella massiliensis]CEE14506.1 hypothetical protein BN1094_03082 [Legionella massiliensis]
MSKNFLIFLFSAAINNTVFAEESSIAIDQFQRLIRYPGKTEVSCPKQDKDTAVLLAIGQSNAANHAEKMFVTKYPTQVFNYFNGKCYIASSPLLGATAPLGELITPLADKLIDNGDYKTVVILPSAIGGSAIERWQQGGDLNSMMQAVIGHSPYRITEVIWHQGESDFVLKTKAEDYKKRFNSLVNSLRKTKEFSPPIYYAIATKCGDNPEWQRANPIAMAQKSLANPTQNIFLAVDTDTLLSDSDRAPDHCHFGETGQVKTANAFAAAIHSQKTRILK